jgi:hypothetical protein
VAFGFADDPDWNMIRGPDEMEVWVAEDGKRVGVQIGEQKRALSPEDAREMATGFARYARENPEQATDEQYQAAMLRRAANRVDSATAAEE